jgi:hypothetical protein
MATRAWRASGGTVSLEAAFDHYAGQLGPALAGPWSTPRTERRAEFDMAIAELVDKTKSMQRRAPGGSRSSCGYHHGSMITV